MTSTIQNQQDPEDNHPLCRSARLCSNPRSHLQLQHTIAGITIHERPTMAVPITAVKTIETDDVTTVLHNSLRLSLAVPEVSGRVKLQHKAAHKQPSDNRL